MQVVYHYFPWVEVEYEFVCRNPNVIFTPIMLENIRKNFEILCDHKLWEDELTFLSKIRFLKPDFISFLRIFRIDPAMVNFELSSEGKLSIHIKGSWLMTIILEVPLLSIVNEVYFREKYVLRKDIVDSQKELYSWLDKMEKENVYWTDFGTRRRFSWDYQLEIVKEAAKHKNFLGTSNVKLASMLNLTPIGTMSHQFIQAGQQVGVRLIDSQKHMLQKWVDEYRGDLGIALTDTLGVDAFLRDFDLYFAKLYDGVRHDSGDPDEWTNKILEHYKNLRIDPRTKQLCYSDGLTFEKAIELNKRYKDCAKVSFGIGTKFTNNIIGQDPLNIVIKMTKCNGGPTAKLSDSPGKTICTDSSYIEYIKKVFNIN